MSAVRRNVRRTVHHERGATAVEFALVLIPLMAILLAIIQYGWYFYASQSASAAAREGARRIVVGDCTASNELLTYIKKQAPMTTAANFSPATLVEGNPVTVTVRANGAIMHFFPLPANGVVEKTFEGRVEDTEPSGACS